MVLCCCSDDALLTVVVVGGETFEIDNAAIALKAEDRQRKVGCRKSRCVRLLRRVWMMVMVLLIDADWVTLATDQPTIWEMVVSCATVLVGDSCHVGGSCHGGGVGRSEDGVGDGGRDAVEVMVVLVEMSVGVTTVVVIWSLCLPFQYGGIHTECQSSDSCMTVTLKTYHTGLGTVQVVNDTHTFCVTFHQRSARVALVINVTVFFLRLFVAIIAVMRLSQIRCCCCYVVVMLLLFIAGDERARFF